MRAVINNRLRERISRDYAMTHEFRQAMLKLCQAQLDPQDVGIGLPQAVKEWLRGELKLISPLKSASIFQKIGRHNARDMLSSLSHWLTYPASPASCWAWTPRASWKRNGRANPTSRFTTALPW